MVPLTTARQVNVSLIPQRTGLVAVFVGGTSGIGEYTLLELAKLAGGNGAASLKVYLIGRNEEAADRIFEQCRKYCPLGTFRFVKVGDLALLENVDACCRQVAELEQDLAEGGKGAGGEGRYPGSVTGDVTFRCSRW